MKKDLAGREINAFKNEILWKLILDVNAEKNQVKKEVEERASGVIREVSQEVETLN